jgi:hypothetical protein
MMFNNGSVVKTAEQWRSRRVEIKSLLETWIVGKPPADVPALVSATTINETLSNGALSRYMSLAYRAANATDVTFTVWTSCPQELPTAGTGRGTMLTQWNHRLWGQRAVGRGLCTIVYPGADDNDASQLFADAYARQPDVWGKIARRAWLASRVIDAIPSLHMPGMGAPGSSGNGGIFITGHSRNGKQSVLAAAFDERITAVVGSSPGAPIASPWRFSSREFMGEGPEFVSDAGAAHPRGWWLPFCRGFQVQ